jgi:FMN phosphatase YigB (HAD superfamily)
LQRQLARAAVGSDSGRSGGGSRPKALRPALPAHLCPASPPHSHPHHPSAYNLPWPASALRYVDDARPFWRRIVSLSLGTSDDALPEALYEELYAYYSGAAAWRLAPGAVAALTRLRASGVKLAVCSNFDTRLRPVLGALGVDRLFDAIIVSAGGFRWGVAGVRVVGAEERRRRAADGVEGGGAAEEARPAAAARAPPATVNPAAHPAPLPPTKPAPVEVGAEKPSPVIFEAAVTQLGVAPAECVHVGDDRRNDVWGGRDAGVTAWLWGYDVHTFEEVARRVLRMQQSGLASLWDEDD